MNKHNHSHFGKGKGRKKGRVERVNEPSKRFQPRKPTSMQNENKKSVTSLGKVSFLLKVMEFILFGWLRLRDEPFLWTG
jgi:hypothetical protein